MTDKQKRLAFQFRGCIHSSASHISPTQQFIFRYDLNPKPLGVKSQLSSLMLIIGTNHKTGMQGFSSHYSSNYSARTFRCSTVVIVQWNEAGSCSTKCFDRNAATGDFPDGLKADVWKLEFSQETYNHKIPQNEVKDFRLSILFSPQLFSDILWELNIVRLSRSFECCLKYWADWLWPWLIILSWNSNYIWAFLNSPAYL